MTAVPAAVLGATGYVGGELLRLIAAHPTFEMAAAVSESRAGQPIANTFPHLAAAFGDTPFAAHGAWLENIPEGSPLALFSAAPHGASAAPFVSWARATPESVAQLQPGASAAAPRAGG